MFKKLKEIVLREKSPAPEPDDNKTPRINQTSPRDQISGYFASIEAAPQSPEPASSIAPKRDLVKTAKYVGGTLLTSGGAALGAIALGFAAPGIAAAAGGGAILGIGTKKAIKAIKKYKIKKTEEADERAIKAYNDALSKEREEEDAKEQAAEREKEEADIRAIEEQNAALSDELARERMERESMRTEEVAAAIAKVALLFAEDAERARELLQRYMGIYMTEGDEGEQKMAELISGIIAIDNPPYHAEKEVMARIREGLVKNGCTDAEGVAAFLCPPNAEDNAHDDLDSEAVPLLAADSSDRDQFTIPWHHQAYCGDTHNSLPPEDPHLE